MLSHPIRQRKGGVLGEDAFSVRTFRRSRYRMSLYLQMASVLTAWELGEMVLNILSACKAEERGVAIATASDDNAADGKTGSASCLKYQLDTTLANHPFQTLEGQGNGQAGNNPVPCDFHPQYIVDPL